MRVRGGLARPSALGGVGPVWRALFLRDNLAMLSRALPMRFYLLGTWLGRQDERVRKVSVHRYELAVSCLRIRPVRRGIAHWS